MRHSPEQDGKGVEPTVVARIPIEYTSPVAFARSVRRRFADVWTKRFVLALLAGQLVSLCITCTDTTTTKLVMRGWELPATQSFFLYFSLMVVYSPWTIYKYGFKGWAQMTRKEGFKYFILAVCDVEANFLVVTAYRYTDLLSCMLLNAWAIPVCLFFSWIYMGTRYHWTQILGIVICIGGLVMLVISDRVIARNRSASAKGKGDILMFVGATLYGFTNATEEFLVRQRPLYEVVGQLGMWGCLICGLQAAWFERGRFVSAAWNGPNAGLLFAFTTALFILYSVAPLLYRLASSTYYNLSLLSSNFYGLLFGIVIFHYSPFWLYFVAFPVVLLGLIAYFWHATPEEQGFLDPQPPKYVQGRKKKNTVKGMEEGVNLPPVPALKADTTTRRDLN